MPLRIHGRRMVKREGISATTAFALTSIPPLPKGCIRQRVRSGRGACMASSRACMFSRHAFTSGAEVELHAHGDTFMGAPAGDGGEGELLDPVFLLTVQPTPGL
jgi:hypothetical protein